MTTATPSRTSFRTALEPKILLALCLGFTSGLPFAAVESTLQAWLTDAKLDLDTIAKFTWVLLPYTLKFMWAPFLDQLKAPILGRRRGWALLSQIGVATCFGLMAMCDPSENLLQLGIIAFLGAFFSASLDISLDAQRREVFSATRLYAASTFFTNGYRIGLLSSGALALALAETLPWWQVYLLLAGLTTASLIFILLAEEPAADPAWAPSSFTRLVLDPFKEFFCRPEWLLVVAFVVLYKVGDSMAAALRTTFLLKMGYAKIDIAAISKGVGLAASLTGAFVGGFSMVKLGLIRSLWYFGMLQAVSTLGFFFVAESIPDNLLLTGVIGFENFTTGLGTSAYVAFMSTMCNPRFGGTQYAGLASLMRIPSLIVGAYTGRIVEVLGWSNFFLLCVAVAFPAFLLIPPLGRVIRSRGEV